MYHILQLRLTPEDVSISDALRDAAAKQLKISARRIANFRILRRSIDARQRQVIINLSVGVVVDKDDRTALWSSLTKSEITYPDVSSKPAVIIVGAGPAGLFAALELIENGLKPIVLERGKPVDERKRDTALLCRQGIVNEDSNYCFGEGGAGAFSDGKLYTRSTKRGPVDKVLRIFHNHGAKDDILIEAHPHIGSDKLPDIIKAIRNTIIASGGEVHFNERVTSLILKDTEVVGVRTYVTSTNPQSQSEYTGPVILATGHSARDVYKMLQTEAIPLQPKGIAVGVRVEHPQQLIDKIIYHSPNGRGKYLPPAEYSLLCRIDNRAVYSFCMCPGGIIVPAASSPGELVVNGMSPSTRGTKWSNSGMVVEILPDDLPEQYAAFGDLKMMQYQMDIERAFFEAANRTQCAPAQRLTDFVNRRKSSSLPQSSYAPGINSGRVDLILPTFVSSRLQDAFKVFGSKYHGFLTDEAIVIGPETRTSSPVRIPRDADTRQNISFSGLYPVGEGAGYAGGIVSAALDGIATARQIVKNYE